MEQLYGRRADDVKVCSNAVVCPTSTREMDELKASVEDAKDDYERLTKEVKTNRKYDIAILIVGILGLVINIVMRSM